MNGVMSALDAVDGSSKGERYKQPVALAA